MHNQLPIKYYFINKFDTNFIIKQDKRTAIIYRNYSSKFDLNVIIQIKKFCKKNRYKFFLSNNFRLALNLNLDGAYIPSFNNNKRHLSYSLKKNFIIIGSAHSKSEIRTKELQGVKCIFLSSIFKKNNNFLGINKFRLISNLTTKKVIALGGISKKNLKQLKLINYFGFAGISFFE